MKDINICVVSPDYPTSRTIDFIFVDQLCRALAQKNGVELTVIAPQTLTKCLLRHIPVAKYKEVINVSEHCNFTLLRPKYFSVGNAGGFLKNHNEKAYCKAVKKAFYDNGGKFDVCYGHFWQSVKALFPLAKKHGIPLIASSGEETVNQVRIGYTDEDVTQISNYVSGIVNVSTNNKSECIETGIAVENKCSVIPNAIDNSLFYPRNKEESRKTLGISEQDFVVAFVGQFTPRKGTLRVDEALKRINDPRVKAFFIGSGPEIPSYTNVLEKGTVAHDKLPVYLSAADVFVLPTLQEGCCNAIIEAMACGLPIISSDLPFNYDVLDITNALLINPNDIDAIAKAIKELLDNPETRQRLSEGAIVKAKELTLTRRAEKILNILVQQTVNDR